MAIIENVSNSEENQRKKAKISKRIFSGKENERRKANKQISENSKK
jgi:hypothetical protein